MFGYHGRLLRVDLTRRQNEIEDLDETTLRKYLGGVGMAAKILYSEVNPQVDPLGPDNVFLAFTGPFTGTRVPSSSRHHVAALSPPFIAAIVAALMSSRIIASALAGNDQP